MIDKSIQQQFFEVYDTPAHVRRHCDAVTACALQVGARLNEAAGMNLDLELIEGAARVHDMARVLDRHDEVGAEFLIEKGYPAEAELVRAHMRHPFHMEDPVTELDVLCIADRVVKEDAYVGIEERIQYLMDKPGMTDEGRAHLRTALQESKQYLSQIEQQMGITLDELCSS